MLLTVFIVVVQNAIGLLLALGVHTRIKSRYVLRVDVLRAGRRQPGGDRVPVEVHLNPQPDAGLNALLGIGLGFLQQDWLGRPELALWSVGLTVVWQFAGYSMVIFLAGAAGRAARAARGRGDRRRRALARFRHIVLPLLAPAMTINLMLSTIGGLKLFDQVFAITNGGPGYATETLSTLIYKQAFVFGEFGYSTAVALVLDDLRRRRCAGAGALPARAGRWRPDATATARARSCSSW